MSKVCVTTVLFQLPNDIVNRIYWTNLLKDENEPKTNISFKYDPYLFIGYIKLTSSCMLLVKRRVSNYFYMYLSIANCINTSAYLLPKFYLFIPNITQLTQFYMFISA